MRIRPIRDTLQKLDQGIQMTTFEPAGDSPQRGKGRAAAPQRCPRLYRPRRDASRPDARYEDDAHHRL